jgi:hypothetical protein
MIRCPLTTRKTSVASRRVVFMNIAINEFLNLNFLNKISESTDRCGFKAETGTVEAEREFHYIRRPHDDWPLKSICEEKKLRSFSSLA